MNPNTESSLSSRLVYICGKDCSSNSTISATLKEKLTIDLARHCFVRSHASPIENLIEAYYAIISSHAFIFVLDTQSICDIDCLNQLGVAVSCNVPVIAVRESNYVLPKILPAKFYQTRIAHKSSQLHVDNRAVIEPSPVSENSTPVTLASVITSCFENAIRLHPSRYGKFLEQLLGCLTGLGSWQNSTNVSDCSLSEDEDSTITHQKRDDKTTMLIQVTGVSSKKVQRRRKSPQTKKSKILDDVYGLDASKLLNRQQVSPVAPYKKINANICKFTPILPSYTKPPSTKSSLKTKSPPRQKLKDSGDRSPVNNRPPVESPNVTINGTKSRDDSKTNRQVINMCRIASPPPSTRTDSTTSDNSNNSGSSNNHKNDSSKDSNESKKHELSIPNSGSSGRRTLRRFSSLPVVPTQYLVASDNKNGSPKVLSYPPPAEPSLLGSRPESVVLFSGDENDYGTIQLSRTCSPVDQQEAFLHSYSTEESSR